MIRCWAVCLAAIARLAGRHDVARGVGAALADGHNVVHRETLEFQAAVRTAVAVDQLDRPPLAGGQVIRSVAGLPRSSSATNCLSHLGVFALITQARLALASVELAHLGRIGLAIGQVALVFRLCVEASAAIRSQPIRAPLVAHELVRGPQDATGGARLRDRGARLTGRVLPLIDTDLAGRSGRAIEIAIVKIERVQRLRFTTPNAAFHSHIQRCAA